MSPFTESTLESAIAELLLQQGYKHYLGSNLKRSKREVVLRDVLVASLQTRYQKQGITSEEVMRAADRLCATPEGNLYDANRATHSSQKDSSSLVKIVVYQTCTFALSIGEMQRIMISVS